MINCHALFFFFLPYPPPRPGKRVRSSHFPAGNSVQPVAIPWSSGVNIARVEWIGVYGSFDDISGETAAALIRLALRSVKWNTVKNSAAEIGILIVSPFLAITASADLIYYYIAMVVVVVFSIFLLLILMELHRITINHSRGYALSTI